MKRLFFFLLAIMLVSCNVPSAPATPTANVGAILTATAPVKAGSVSSSATSAASAVTGKRPLIIAHRGGAGLAPEDTLASFRNGIALGADFIEMDAHLTKDGVPVIIHDASIDRTTDGSGRVADFTLARLQSFNAAAKFSGGAFEKQVVPTFAQVLDLAKPTRVYIEVEIKLPSQGRYAGIEQKMIDEIAARDMLDRVQISSFNFDVLKDVKTISPRTKTVALLSVDYFRGKNVVQVAAMIDEIQSIGADLIAVNKDLLTPQLVQEAQKRSVKVEVWTVDSESDMQKFITMGVDGIMSNRPDELKKALGR